MAIRHLKTMQTQEVLREAAFIEHYRSGYSDCVNEAAKFLMREKDEELYYKMITHLRDHLNEMLKAESVKTRCNGDLGSPAAYHPPLSQLREMLTSASDLEQSSNDHHDVKDLSFRNNPPQTPTINSTSASAPHNIHHHMDTSDYDSTRSPTTSSGTTSTTSVRVTTANISQHLNNLSPPHAHENSTRSVRMRKLSETSTDVEHFNNSYKFKNYIQQRFTHENYHSEESMQSTQCATEHDKDHHHDKKSSSTPSPHHLDAPKLNGHHDIKSEVLISNSPSPAHQQANNPRPRLTNGVSNGNAAIAPHHSIPIPIFACHTQGFYVPLNVDYDVLMPFLGGIDLLSKSYSHISPLHPISININYSPAMLKNGITSANFIKPKVENGLLNGW